MESGNLTGCKPGGVKLSLIAGAVFSLGLQMQHPAQAGTWEAGITKAIGNTRIWKPSSPGATPAPPTPWTNGSGGVWRLTEQGPSAYKEAIGIDANGSVSCFFHWRPGVLPDGTLEPVPEWASFLVTTTAHGSANSSSDQNLESRRDLAKEHVTVTAGGKTLSGGDVQSNTFASLNPKILLLVKSNGDADIEIPGVQLRATASLDDAREYWITYSGPYGYFSSLNGYAHAGLDYRAQEDVRRVYITCPQIETSFWKDSLRRTPHERDSNGSITTDSVVHWLKPANGPSKGWIGGGTFTASPYPSNFSVPTYNWSASGGQFLGVFPDTDRHTWDLSPAMDSITGNLFSGIHLGSQADGSDLIRGTTIKLMVTDSGDGAVAESTFGVAWHFPYEKYETLPDGPHQVGKVHKLAGPLVPGEGCVIHAGEEDFPLDAVIDGIAVGAEVTGNEEVAAIFKIIGGLNGLAQHYTGTSQPDPTWTNDGGPWIPTVINHPESITDSLDGDLRNADGSVNHDGYSFYDMEIHLVKRWHVANWLADKYDGHGFVSNNHALSANFIESLEPEAFYKRRPVQNP